jgi:hypothetical protein
MILMVIIDVTKFIIVKNKGLWYVQLKSSIDITHTTYKPRDYLIQHQQYYMILKIDVNGLVIFFNCKVNITADDRNVYIGFYPLLTDLECCTN